MAKMSKDQWEQFVSGVEASPAQAESIEAYDAPFKYDPKAQDAGLINALRMVGNVPYSAYSAAGDIAGVVSDIPGTIEGGARLIAGSGEEVSRRLFGTGDTDNAQMLRQVGSSILNRYSNPGQTLVEDPVGMGVDIAGLLAGGGAATGVNKLRSLNPVRAIPKAAGSVGENFGIGARKAIEQGARVTTGFEAPAFEQIYQAKKAGGERSEIVNHFMRPQALQKKEKWGAQQLYDTVHNLTEGFLSDRSADYKKSMKSLTLKDDGAPINLHTVKNKVMEILQDDKNKIGVVLDEETGLPVGLDFSKSKIGKSGEQKAIQDTFLDIVNWKGNDIDEVDFLKQRIGSHRVSGGDQLNYKGANILVDDMYRVVRDELGEKVARYDETMGRYEKATDFLRNLDKNVGALGKEETVVNKLIPILRDPANFDFRRNFVKDLEAKTGVNLKDQVAAMELSQVQAKGLLGRSAMVGGLGYASGSTDWLWLLPATSPYVMGELFGAMGATAKQGKRARKFMQDLYQKLPSDAVVDGLTVGAVINKYLDPEWQPNTPASRLMPAQGRTQPNQ
jgi:hypothetical protein